MYLTMFWGGGCDTSEIMKFTLVCGYRILRINTLVGCIDFAPGKEQFVFGVYRCACVCVSVVLTQVKVLGCHFLRVEDIPSKG